MVGDVTPQKSQKDFPGDSLPVWDDSNDSAKSGPRACTHLVGLGTNLEFPTLLWLLVPFPEPQQGVVLGFGHKTNEGMK